MKKVIKLLMMLSVMITVLLGATTAAHAYTYGTVQVGDSNVTIETDLTPEETYLTGQNPSTVDVTYTLTSDNKAIKRVIIDGDIHYPLERQKVTVEHTFNKIGGTTLQIVMEDWTESDTYLNVPEINPGPIYANNFSLGTDSTGLKVINNADPAAHGENYFIYVYSDKARTKKLAIFQGTTGQPSVIKKSANSWYKPGKTYYLKMYPAQFYKLDGETKLAIGQPTDLTFVAAPTTKPVIKSVKISNVKVTKKWNWDQMRYMYTTTYKAKITLSKKATGTKGIYVNIHGSDYKVSGTGKTFTVSCRDTGTKSFKGTSVKIKLRTYSASEANGSALSPISATKSFTVKNGTKTY